MKADISEVFSSWQGEGLYLGERQIFIRFADCNINCSYCDTAHENSPRNLSIDELLADISRLDKEFGAHHSVTLTGGEPLLHKDYLLELLPELKKNNFSTYLETNGTLAGPLKELIGFVDIVAMDIKLPSSTGKKDFWNEHAEFLKIAKEKKVFTKIVVTKRTSLKDFRKGIDIVINADKNIPLILQPATISGDFDCRPTPSKMIDFLNFAKHNLSDVRIIPQVHKILGVR